MSESEQSVFLYVVDTSFLIEVHKRYPEKMLPGIWKDIEALIRAGRIVAPIKVKDEINQQDDELKEWVNNHDEMFKPLNRELLETTAIVVNKYPRTAKPTSQNPHHADPFVIGLAMKMRRVRSLIPQEIMVIAEEKSKLAKIPGLSEAEIEKIPDVCSRMDIPCITHLEMFKKEGFRFY
jgi:hypothetical protein